MQRNWTNKNVDLVLLTMRIGDFFKEKEFETVEGEIPTGYEILAKDSPYFKIQGYASVNIEGNPEDFTVKIHYCGYETSHSRFSSLLLRMFGGGYLVLRQQKSQEAWTKLEKKLWRYVENAVLHLTNSAET
jgi:hypothetical protein